MLQSILVSSSLWILEKLLLLAVSNYVFSRGVNSDHYHKQILCDKVKIKRYFSRPHIFHTFELLTVCQDFSTLTVHIRTID